MSNVENCIICENRLHSYNYLPLEDITVFDCHCCGCYKFARGMETQLKKMLIETKLNGTLSNWLLNNQDIVFDSNNIKNLRNLRRIDPHTRAINLFLYMTKFLTEINRSFPLELMHVLTLNFQQGRLDQYLEENDSDIVKYWKPKIFKMLPISNSTQFKEIDVLINDYLRNDKNFIKLESTIRQYFDPAISITPDGWAFLNDYNKGKHHDQAFIALKYETELLEYFRKWIIPAIKEAGYKAIIIGDKAHSNIIDDEMKIEIKRSKFIISDLTINSRGAYYEAGYAHGIGIPVIFTCEKSYFKKPPKPVKFNKIHFDTDHYPITLWEYGEIAGAKFKEKIKSHILSDEFIGKGNYHISS